MRNVILGLSIFLGFALTGCGGGVGTAGTGAGPVGASSAGGGQTTAAQTNLVVYLSDSPVDEADAVFVTVERVEVLHDEEGAQFEVLADDPQQFDLLTLQNDVQAVLGEGGFPPGDYAGIRLILADNGFNVGPQVNVPDATVLPNYIVTDGDASPLFTPSGTQTGIKLLDRCSDHPELGPEWQKAGRAAGRDRITTYLESLISSGVLRPVHDVRAAGRIVIETIATWAMHIKWDPAQRFDDDVARDTAIEFMLRGLLPD